MLVAKTIHNKTQTKDNKNNTDVKLDLTLDVLCYGVIDTSTKDGVTNISTKNNKNNTDLNLNFDNRRFMLRGD